MVLPGVLSAALSEAWTSLLGGLDWLYLAWVWAWAWVGARWARPRRDDWAVYKVYAFDERPCDERPDDGPGFQELPARHFDPDSWEADALDATGFERARVEVRYRHGGQKFRMVLRPGDACVFPPPRRPAGFRVSAVAASLHGPRMDVDVTKRMFKYRGATRDFHGTRVTVRDMFPFDDHEENALRFSHLRLIDSMARVKVVPYLSDDSVAP